ncbi:MAG: C-GCAxxG-C-C family protein [Lachnospiraceae bacterium]|nr:C-GCAxxG-C-C family protein [Lachnospiraceae bacterium]
MTHKEKAMKIFYEKFNCSQAVLGAYADDYGLTEYQAMKVAACFSGGVRKGEVCGAVSGAIMVIGLKYGDGPDYKATAYPNSFATSKTSISDILPKVIGYRASRLFSLNLTELIYTKPFRLLMINLPHLKSSENLSINGSAS